MISAEKKVVFGTVAALVAAFIFAPYQRATPTGNVVATGWKFIWEMGYRETVNITMLATTWLGILIVAGLLWYATKKTQ